MALYVKNPEVVRLVDALVRRTGENKTEVLLRALRDRKDQLDKNDSLWKVSNRSRLSTLLEKVDALPVLDPRSPDEILGYTESGTL